MQQPPPRGRRSFWQWYRAQTRFARIGLGCASIFVALLLCTVALTVYGSTLLPTRTPALTQAPTHAVVLTTPRPTATQATFPTATPTTTPTPTPSKVTVPHLGGATSMRLTYRLSTGICRIQHRLVLSVLPSIRVMLAS